MRTPTPFILILAGALVLQGIRDTHAAPPPGQDTGRTHIELGFGLAGAHFPDYPGAARDWNLLLPLPYITLKSPRLDANRDGLHGKLFKSERWSLNLDFGGAVPVSSSRDAERHGMPDLDWMLGVGPILKYHAWRSPANGFTLDVSLAERIATSFEGVKAHHRGWVTEPHIELARNWGNGDNHYHADVGLSWTYASHDYFNYIYGVAPQYADATRAAYRSGGGYGGYVLSLGFGVRRGDFVYGAFYRYLNLSGARFSDSPLVSRRHQNAFGFAVAWIFKRMDY